MNATMAPKYRITILFIYIWITSAIVFIYAYQQQICMFATNQAIFYLFHCVRVHNQWKKVGGVTKYIYFL